MKLTRRKLATVLTATAVAAQAAPQTPAPQAEADDLTAARNALKASLDTLTRAKVPIELEPVTHFKA